jgi:hypothetical protein
MAATPIKRTDIRSSCVSVTCEKERDEHTAAPQLCTAAVHAAYRPKEPAGGQDTSKTTLSIRYGCRTGVAGCRPRSCSADSHAQATKDVNGRPARRGTSTPTKWKQWPEENFKCLDGKAFLLEVVDDELASERAQRTWRTSHKPGSPRCSSRNERQLFVEAHKAGPGTASPVERPQGDRACACDEFAEVDSAPS